jgi:molybdate transport system substrate-binding protein
MVRSMLKTRTLAVGLVAALGLLAACGSSSNTSGTTTTAAAGAAATTTQPKLSGGITVLAASSLTNGFTALGKEFEASYPGTKVTFSFGSSSELEQQIEQGAPADVFASADQANMDKVVRAGDNAGDPTDFVKNKLEIAVEKGNPKHIATLADLTKPGTIVVLCDVSVPCGKFANQVLTNAKVSLTPKSREINVKATLTKVELGEADAAIVYVSDVASSAGKVTGVPIPDAVNVITTLPVVTLKGAANSSVANAFVSFVAAHKDELVSKYGFLPL